MTIKKNQVKLKLNAHVTFNVQKAIKRYEFPMKVPTYEIEEAV
jgi:hypothetical protein